MNIYAKTAIVAGLMMVVGTLVILNGGGTCSTCRPGPILLDPSEFQADISNAVGLPRLVELGSTTCIPCQMMKPIIEELTVEYEGILDVVFVDVQKDLDETKKYNIKTIPTQIFVGPSGKELFRHEGIFSKEDIVAKWAELGFELTPR